MYKKRWIGGLTSICRGLKCAGERGEGWGGGGARGLRASPSAPEFDRLSGGPGTSPGYLSTLINVYPL